MRCSGLRVSHFDNFRTDIRHVIDILIVRCGLNELYLLSTALKSELPDERAMCALAK